MEFKKFESIENAYRQKWVNTIQAELGNKDFVVLEKIHGANFSFYTNGSEVKCAKRTSFLDQNENFYNFQKVHADNLLKVLSLHELLEEKLGMPIKELIVMGELYGGNYPAPGVPVDNTSKGVQKEVLYRPDVGFICYDISVEGAYLSEVDRLKYLSAVGISASEPLFIGSLSDCLSYKNEFQTTIPKLLGLPEIEDNTCEGTIIKPLIPAYLRGGRAIIKNKNAKFTERDEKVTAAKLPSSMPKHIQDICDIAKTLINYNRLSNVVSKIGNISMKDFINILRSMREDVMLDLVKEVEVAEADVEIINNYIMKESALMMRTQLINLIDGDKR